MKVLIVEDNPISRKLTRVALESDGLTVTEAQDGRSAIASVSREVPDLILQDILLPDIDGFDLVGRLHSLPGAEKIPVLALTGLISKGDEAKLPQANFADYLFKPVDPSFLISTVRAHLAASKTSISMPGQGSEHKESLLRRLNRQARLSVDLARRCAAQSAQISVLASAAQNFLRSGQNIDSLLSEILSHYLAVIGFSRGAVYLLDQGAGLKLSSQIGFPQSGETALADFFGSAGLLHEAMSRAEPVVFSSPADEAEYQALLTQASVRSILIAPLSFDERALGAIALFSDTRGLYPEWIHFSKLINGQISQAVALWQTISQLKYLAVNDPLTALPNRARLIERARELLSLQEGSVDIALLRVNIDRFEEINNALGYNKGDEVLRQFARRLESAVGSADMLARLDADEFGVIFLGNGIAHEASERARAILNALDAPFMIDGLALDVHASIGMAQAPDDARDAEDLLRRADMAMRAAKRSAAGFVPYTAAIDQYEPHRLTLMGELSSAIEHDELSLFYQPKVSFKTNRIVGVEALLRWQHPERGLIPPDQFIPLAEKTGAIQRLTHWVLKNAIRQSTLWRRAGYQLNVSLNLSVRNLLEPAFPQRVLAMLNSDGASAECITMEITESALMADPAKARNVLIFLSRHGIRFSIDDFGTGYSSLAYLKHLPVREIKIDKLFVSRLMTDADNTTIVRSTIDLGHNLGLLVTAEGVEDQETWNTLGALGCDEAQGYFMGRPLPVAQFEKWLQESKWGIKPSGAQ
jgi:diguanylate cyclase (GGDEF)-like protein